MQQRAYSRTPYERTGQTNWRKPSDVSNPIDVGQEQSVDSSTPRDPSRVSRFDRDPDCVIFTTKSKHFDTIAKDSQVMPVRTAEMARTVFPPNNFFRYQTNIYLKGK